MKPCSRCGDLKADDQFARDESRDDGLAICCRDCNKAKCKAWYAANQERKRRLSLEYKATHGATPWPATRRGQRKKAAKAEEPDDFQLIRFSASEWLFCLQEAQILGISANQYVRNLVGDARAASRLSGIETTGEGDGNAQI